MTVRERIDAGLPLTIRDLAELFEVGIDQIYKNARLGKYDDFLLRPAFGPRKYSGVKVGRYLAGEALEELSFGRKRSA